MSEHWILAWPSRIIGPWNEMFNITKPCNFAAWKFGTYDTVLWYTLMFRMRRIMVHSYHWQLVQSWVASLHCRLGHVPVMAQTDQHIMVTTHLKPGWRCLLNILLGCGFYPSWSAVPTVSVEDIWVHIPHCDMVYSILIRLGMWVHGQWQKHHGSVMSILLYLQDKTIF